MESQEIIEAMKNKFPVIYNGTVYKEIKEYILWFDGAGNKQRSVVLIDENQLTLDALESKESNNGV